MENEEPNHQMDQHQDPSDVQSRCTLETSREKSEIVQPTKQKIQRLKKTRRGNTKSHGHGRTIIQEQKKEVIPNKILDLLSNSKSTTILTVNYSMTKR